MENSIQYEDRIVCFLDLLGFKDTVSKSGENTEVFNRINTALDLFLNFEKDQSTQVTCFSDSVVISFLVNDKSMLFHTLLNLQYLIFDILTKSSLLVRGAISYGKLVHTDTKIFGEGLIKAYELESKFAIYPRIIIDKDVIELGKMNGRHQRKLEKEYILGLLRPDVDGFYFIDYLISIGTGLDTEYDYPIYLRHLRDFIIKGLTTDNLSVKIKYEWLKTHFNHIASQIGTNKHNPGDQELFEVYSSISAIA